MVPQLIEWYVQLNIVNLFLFVYHIEMKQVHIVKQKDYIYIYILQRSLIPLIVEQGYRPEYWLGALVRLRMYKNAKK